MSGLTGTYVSRFRRRTAALTLSLLTLSAMTLLPGWSNRHYMSRRKTWDFDVANLSQPGLCCSVVFLILTRTVL